MSDFTNPLNSTIQATSLQKEQGGENHQTPSSRRNCINFVKFCIQHILNNSDPPVNLANVTHEEMYSYLFVQVT